MFFHINHSKQIQTDFPNLIGCDFFTLKRNDFAVPNVLTYRYILMLMFKKTHVSENEVNKYKSNPCEPDGTGTIPDTVISVGIEAPPICYSIFCLRESANQQKAGLKGDYLHYLLSVCIQACCKKTVQNNYVSFKLREKRYAPL